MPHAASTLVPQMPSKVAPSSPFGQRLMQARRAQGLTQSQLADMIGSSQRAISHYETVADYPPAANIVALAKALKISGDELFGLKSPKSPPKPKDDPETRRLWKKFKLIASLPEKDRRAVIRLVNSLVSVRNTA